MDPIKQFLKGKKIEPKVETVQQEEEIKELNVAECLLADHFLKHIADVQKYLLTGNADTRKVLLMADMYAAQRNSKDICSYMSQSIHPRSWTALVAYELRKEIDSKITEAYRGPRAVGKTLQQQIAEDVLYAHVDLDFGKYQERIKTNDQNLVVLCDNLFAIDPAASEVKDIRKMFREKVKHVEELLDSYSINVRASGLESLYLLEGIKELKQ